MALHRRCTSVRFSIQHPRTLGRPSQAGARHPHAMVGPGYTGGWSVSQSVVSNFLLDSGAQVHLGDDAHSKQWAALNASSLWAYLVGALDNIHEVICGLSIGINVLPGLWHIIWACGLSTRAAYSRDFTVLSTLFTRVSSSRYLKLLNSNSIFCKVFNKCLLYGTCVFMWTVTGKNQGLSMT